MNFKNGYVFYCMFPSTVCVQEENIFTVSCVMYKLPYRMVL